MRNGSIEREASRWIIRQSGGMMSTEDEAVFAAWLTEPAHRAAFEQLQQLWQRLGRVDAPRLRMAAKRRRARRAATALILMLAPLIAWFVPDIRLHMQADQLTATGEVRRMSLADGSMVTLDAESAIAVDLTTNARTIRLLKGRALFEVAPDKARPFVVETGDAAARALGTRFEVSRYADHTEVTVIESHVAVRCLHCAAQRDEIALAPGDKAEVSDAGIQSGRTDPATAAAWTEGMLVFDAVPLADAIEELQRYAGPHILISGDDRVRGHRVSAVVSTRDPEAALATLAAGADLSVSRLPGLLIIGY